MKDGIEVETPDYGERKGTPAFIPATQLHLRGPLSLAEAKKAPVMELPNHAGAARQKRRAA